MFSVSVLKKRYSLNRFLLTKNCVTIMAISTNRPGHRASDAADWGPTLKKKLQHSSSIHITYYMEFNFEQSKIVSGDKFLNGN